WGEEFFPRKNSFLLIKILPTSLPPYLPTSPQIKFSGNETALPILGVFLGDFDNGSRRGTVSYLKHL
ncbi:MAG: hypothetical protein WBB43_26105, partial [Limnoraphis sp.]